MANKRLLKLKKDYKRWIRDSVRKAEREDKYCILFFDGEIERVFYKGLSSVDTNEEINSLASLAAYEQYYAGPTLVVTAVSDSIPRSMSYYYRTHCIEGKVYACALAGCQDEGKHFKAILREYDRLFMGVLSGGFNPDTYDVAESPNYQIVLETLLKLVNDYELLCISDSGYFWRPDYFRKVTRAAGLSYLPTVRIELGRSND